MKHEDYFIKSNKKRVNPNSWQETDSHLDHAAGEYEPLSSNDDIFPKQIYGHFA